MTIITGLKLESPQQTSSCTHYVILLIIMRSHVLMESGILPDVVMQRLSQPMPQLFNTNEIKRINQETLDSSLNELSHCLNLKKSSLNNSRPLRTIFASSKRVEIVSALLPSLRCLRGVIFFRGMLIFLVGVRNG